MVPSISEQSYTQVPQGIEKEATESPGDLGKPASWRPCNPSRLQGLRVGKTAKQVQSPRCKGYGQFQSGDV